MIRHTIGSPAIRALVLAAAVGNLGAQCNPYTLDVEEGARRFHAVDLAQNATSAWDPGALRAQGLPVGDDSFTSAIVRLRAPSPLEVYAFTTDPIGVAEQVPSPGRFSSLPANPTPAGQVLQWTATLPHPVSHLRLIDHGSCNLPIAFITGTPEAGGNRITTSTNPDDLFPALDRAFQEEMRSTCRNPSDPNAICDITSSRHMGSLYQAMFLQRADQPPNNRGLEPLAPSIHRDGFWLRYDQRFFGNTFLLIIPVYGEADLTIEAYVALSVGDDGFFAATPTYVNASGSVFSKAKDPEAARNAVLDKLRTTLQAELVRRLRQAVSVPILLSEDAPDDAYCRRPDAKGRPFAASLLAAMIQLKLGKSAPSPAEGEDIVARLDPARFVAMDDADGKRRCKYVPRFRRVNVLPAGMELVLADAGESTGESRLYLALAPERLQCGLPSADGGRIYTNAQKTTNAPVPIYASPPE